MSNANPLAAVVGLVLGWIIGSFLVIAFSDEIMDFIAWLPTWNDPVVVQEYQPPPECSGKGCAGPVGMDGS